MKLSVVIPAHNEEGCIEVDPGVRQAIKLPNKLFNFNDE